MAQDTLTYTLLKNVATFLGALGPLGAFPTVLGGLL